MEEVPSYKIVLVGDSSVGKTCLFSKFTKGNLPKVIEPTVGQEFKTKSITMQDGKQIKANIWDTAGQERYRSVMSSNYRKAVGAVLIYDITQRETFNSLQKWIAEIKQHAEPDIIFTIVGNKSDLSSSRLVQKNEGEQFAKENNSSFFETSAQQGVNITELFEQILNQIHNNRKIKPVASSANQNQGGAQISSADIQQRQQAEGGCKC